MADTDDALRREVASVVTDAAHDFLSFTETAEILLAGPIAKHTAALQAENARLTDERDEARADLETRKGITVRSIRSANFHCSRAETAEAQLAAVTARVEALEAALRFYADPEIYKPHPHGPAFDRRDLSWHARALLPVRTNEDRHDD